MTDYTPPDKLLPEDQERFERWELRIASLCLLSVSFRLKYKSIAFPASGWILPNQPLYLATDRTLTCAIAQTVPVSKQESIFYMCWTRAAGTGWAIAQHRQALKPETWNRTT